jgi:hypothetical protein
MKSLALLALLALPACASTKEWAERHPRTATFVAGSLLLSAGMAYRSHGGAQDEPRMSAPLTPDCARYPELCR